MKTKLVLTSALVALSIIFLAACGGPMIVSGYGSALGANALPRMGAHPGVDFGDLEGSPVLAAADGRVIAVVADKDIEAEYGHGVLIQHNVGYTAYWHLKEVSVSRSNEVRRGEKIGRIALVRQSFGVPHVHFEVCSEPCPWGHRSGNLVGTLDPMKFFVGCFDPARNGDLILVAAKEEGERLLLTYPVRCTDAGRKKTNAPPRSP